jgi:hypothetical protein
MRAKRFFVCSPFALAALAACVVLGLPAAPASAGVGCATVIEDFESYTVADGEYLDPTSVVGSGWSDDDFAGLAAPDWEVACCSGTTNLPHDYTFDGSDKHLRLRTIGQATLNTDFKLAQMTAGTVAFEVNPSGVGDGGDAFHGGLFDAVGGEYKVRVGFLEFFGTGTFQVRDGVGTILAQGFGHEADRWFRVSITTFTNGTFDVNIDDIGPTSTSVSGDPAQGSVIAYSGSNDVQIVDVLRLNGGSNGGNNDFRPTMIDNIAQCVDVAAPTQPIAGVAILPAKKITFPTLAEVPYQPQFIDNLLLANWANLGGGIFGDGTTNCVFDSTSGTTTRAYRVTATLPPEIPPIVEDFEYVSVSSNQFIDVTTLSTNWTRDGDPGTNAPDWIVDCCSSDGSLGDGAQSNGSGRTEATFDGSDRYLALDRDNNELPPPQTDENSDFNLAAVVGGPLSNHTVSVEINPSSTGDSGPNAGAINLALYDSSSGKKAMRVIFREVTSNAGDFEVYDDNDILLATGFAPDSGNVQRWFRLLIRLRGDGAYDVFADDIGPTTGTPTSFDPARGRVLILENQPLPFGVTSVDLFRLVPGSGNGGATTDKPTVIDNIGAGPNTGTVGGPIGGVDCVAAKEITYPTDNDTSYQTQYSDDGGSLWIDLGPRTPGTGLTESTFDVCVDGRQWRVLDLRP